MKSTLGYNSQYLLIEQRCLMLDIAANTVRLAT